MFYAKIRGYLTSCSDDCILNDFSNAYTFVYAPNFEKVDGAYCFWSVRAWVGGCVRAWVRHTFCTFCNF